MSDYWSPWGQGEDESTGSARSALLPLGLLVLLAIVIVMFFGSSASDDPEQQATRQETSAASVGSKKDLPDAARTETGRPVARDVAGQGTTEPGETAAQPVEDASQSSAQGLKLSAEQLAAVAPQVPWQTVLPEVALTRIGVGSCLSQRHPQPIWSGVLDLPRRPDLFLMIGDNVYGDVRDQRMDNLVKAYQTQLSHPEFAKARAALPMLGIWDDHDYGANDAGAGFAFRTEAAALFKAFWQLDKAEMPEAGVYHSRRIGPEGQQVQLIFLDTRTFRGELTRKGSDFPHWGRYQPSDAEEQTLLGEAQWAWLAEQLAQPADLRVIVSSIQVLAEGHGFERWGNLPGERERLYELLKRSGIETAFILSGDRHAGGFYRKQIEEGPRLIEMTASSLNRSYGPSKDGAHPSRISRMFHQENFGLIDLDWAAREAVLSLRGMAGQPLHSETVRF